MGEQVILFNHRPSVLSSHMMCTAKALMEHGLPNEDTEYTIEGTNVHALLSYCIINKIDDVSSFEGQAFKYVNDKGDIVQFLITEEHIKSLRFAIGQILVNCIDYDDVKSEVVMENAVIPRLDSCTVDIIFKEENRLHVMDYKNGATPVYAEDNKQMICYAYSAYKRYNLPDVDTVVMTIIQPNSRNNVRVTDWEISIEELLEKVEEIRRVTDKIDNGIDIEFNVGNACTFCKAKSFCKSYLATPVSEYEMLKKELESFKKENSLPYKLVEEIYESGDQFNDLFSRTEDDVTFVTQLQAIINYGYIFDESLSRVENLLQDDSYLDSINRQDLLEQKKDLEKLKNLFESRIKHLVDVKDLEVNYTLEKGTGRSSFIDLGVGKEGIELYKKLKEMKLLEEKPLTITNIKKQIGESKFKKELEKFTTQPVTVKLKLKSDSDIALEKM